MRRSSVFPMPVRGAFDFQDYSQANAWSKANGHGGIVKQAWNLKPKLLQLESAVLAAPEASVYEAHPELAFARLSSSPMLSKKSKEGREQRLALLQSAGILGLENFLQAVPRSLAGPDDLLDAAVLLITARRILSGVAIHYPDAPRINAQGLAMRIWV
jgi:predicted RNase H-like nuclease